MTSATYYCELASLKTRIDPFKAGRSAAFCSMTLTFDGGAGSQRHRGFSMTELMVTLAVAAILVAVAVPNFKSLIDSSTRTSTSNDLEVAINTARTEAVRRNATVQFCSNSAGANGTDALGGQCGTETGAVWWMPNGTSSAPVKLLDGIHGIVSPVQISGSGGAVRALRFNGQGLAKSATSSSATPYTGVVSDICTASDKHEVISMIAGSTVSVSSSPADSASTCP